MSKQINQYTKTRTSGTVKDDDLLDFDSTEDSGSTFESAKITVLNFVNYLITKIATFYVQDGTLTGDRTVTQSGFWARFKGGDVISEMSNEFDEHGFIVQAVGQIEKGRFSYDPVNASSILNLKNNSGDFFEANDGVLKVNNDVLFVDSDNIGIGTDTPSATNKLDIEVATGINPLGIYENKVGGASIGDNMSLSFDYNDIDGNRQTSSASILSRVTGTSSGAVNSSLTFANTLQVTSQGTNKGGVLVHPSAATTAPTAMLEVKQTASSVYNACLSLTAKGDTASQALIITKNLSGNQLFNLNAQARAWFNVSQFSTGDFRVSGQTDAELVFVDASEDNIGFGTSTPDSSAKVEINSTTQGFLPPRMTTVERDAITTPAGGLMVFNTTTSKMNFYNGSVWEEITSA